MKHPAVSFALIAFFFSIAWTLMEHALGYNSTNHATGQYTRLVPALVFYLCVVLAILKKRKQQHKVLSFAQGFRTGAGVALLYGLLVTVWFAIYAELINPVFQSTLMDFERAKLPEGSSPDVVAAKMREVELTSGGSVVSYLILFCFMTIIGTAVAALASVFLKRKRRY